MTKNQTTILILVVLAIALYLYFTRSTAAVVPTNTMMYASPLAAPLRADYFNPMYSSYYTPDMNTTVIANPVSPRPAQPLR